MHESVLLIKPFAWSRSPVCVTVVVCKSPQRDTVSFEMVSNVHVRQLTVSLK